MLATVDMHDSPNRLKVKLLLRFAGTAQEAEDELLHRFPGKIPSWGNCDFLLDPEARDYDWLVVYDDLAGKRKNGTGVFEEILACPRKNTLLITSEPHTIKIYTSGYVQQYGHVLTTQERPYLRHPHTIHSQPALIWFYGRRSQRGDYDFMHDHPPLEKSRTISAMCSAKQQKHTLHNARFQFLQTLGARMPELDLFGFGMKPIQEKADALDPYKYHIAIENFLGTHHWTEKLSDAFLGHCLPFYYGCPNVFEYFPEESCVCLDITDFERSLAKITETIRDNTYEKRISAITEARNLVLEKYGLFSTIAKMVNGIQGNLVSDQIANTSEKILQRHRWRKTSWINSTAHVAENFFLRRIYR